MNAAKIIVIDKQKIFCEALTNMLRFSGFTIQGFASEENESYALIDSFIPNIIIIDINFDKGEKAGIDFIRRIKNKFISIFIIVLTDLSRIDLLETAIRSGVDAYVIKKNGFDDLKIAIQYVLDGKLYISPDIQDKILKKYFERNILEIIKDDNLLIGNDVIYKSIIENADLVMFILDKNGYFIYVSDFITELTGYKKEEIIGKSYKHYINSQDIDIILEKLKNEEKFYKNITIRIIDKNNNILTGKVSGSRLNNIYIGILIDNTKLVRIKENLKSIEERYTILSQNSLDVVVVIDKNKFILSASPSIYHILGYSETELIGENLIVNILPDDLSLVMNSFDKVIENSGNREIVIYRFKNKDGEYRIMENIFVNYIDNSCINGVVINSHDITDRIKTDVKFFNLMLQQLSSREKECLILYAKGFDKKDISIKMNVERETIDKYSKRILEKMDKSSIDELVDHYNFSNKYLYI